MKKRNTKRGLSSRNRLIRLEALESRAMLAGNVSVSVTGGNLNITGDGKDNLVLVEQVGTGQYAITGANFADSGLVGYQAGPTRINNSPNGTVVVSGVTGDINVNLNGGKDVIGMGNSLDDLVALADEAGIVLEMDEEEIPNEAARIEPEPVEGRFFAPRHLFVNTGAGNDTVVVNADVKGLALINTGDGNDGVAFGSPSQAESQVLVGLDVTILTGNGNDSAGAINFAANGLLNVNTAGGNDRVLAYQFGVGAVSIVTGAGNDVVDVESFTTDRTVFVDTGAGNDFAFLENFSAGQGFGPNEQEGAGFVTVITGAGNDEAELEFFEAEGVTVDTGAGNDGTAGPDSPITVAFAEIDTFLTIVTGAGNDLVQVYEVEARDAVINTGAGNDGTSDFPIEVYNSSFRNLTIDSGAGNDWVYVASGDGEIARISNNLVIVTQAGNDYVQVLDQSIGRDLTINLGAGNDIVVVAATDEEEVTGMTVGNNLTLDAGAGNDQVYSIEADIHNNLFAFLGAGNDLLDTFGSEVGGDVLIDAGAGNDNVSLTNSFVEGNARIFMGAGNDTLVVVGSNGNGRLYAYGGPGRDTFVNDLGIDSNGIFGDAEVREFEFFEDEEIEG